MSEQEVYAFIIGVATGSIGAGYILLQWHVKRVRELWRIWSSDQ